MKRTRAVSLLLCASMVIPMTGCSGRKKAVIEAADSYASALLAGDIDDIADLMEDDDEFEEAMEDYLDRFTANEELEDIYEFILENTTYEIDKKSVVVSEKKAIVEITYTMIDYMDVADELDDDADADDYLDELEDNTGNAMEIRQKIELKPVKDEWKIVDDDFENTLEVYEFYEEISALRLGILPVYTIDELKEMIIDIYNASDYEVTTLDIGTYDTLMYFSDDLSVTAMGFDSSSDAAEYYEDAYNMLLDVIGYQEIDGEFIYYFDGQTGYILIDGELHDEYSYGGIYLSEDIILIITVGDRSETDSVDEFLNAIGYPTP